MSLDLKDAYLLIPITEEYCSFLTITIFHQCVVHHYQFRALSFGLTSAPEGLQKWYFQLLQPYASQVIQIVPYGDWMIIAQNPRLLWTHLNQTISLLSDLGFLLNLEKSNLNPSPRKLFLGFIIDSLKIHNCQERESLQSSLWGRNEKDLRPPYSFHRNSNLGESSHPRSSVRNSKSV